MDNEPQSNNQDPLPVRPDASAQAPNPEPQPVISNPAPSVTSAPTGNNVPPSVARKPKLLIIILSSVVVLVVLLVLFLLVLPGSRSYLNNDYGNTLTPSTPANCTTTTTKVNSVKGFPLAYSFKVNVSSTFHCFSSGQGEGEDNTTVAVSPGGFFPKARIGLGVDALAAVVLTAIFAIVFRKITKKRSI